MMRTMSLVTLLLYILYSVHTQSTQGCPGQMEKLPSYLGRGYDILIGNPLSSTVDPGFKFDVIVLDYNQKRKTEDNKFLVPDNISFQKAQSCSLKSDVNEYRGTKSYQDQLKLIVKQSFGAEINGFGGAFSRSLGWRNLENKVQKQQTVVYQAIAECQNYVLALDRYQAYKVSTNFFAAVELSMQLNNWVGFFSQFGTHYISEVTMGGRAVQQSEFNRNSVSQLKQKGIDASIGAKITFAGAFNSIETSASWTTTQQQEYNYLRSKISNFYIGGRPPLSGSITAWQQQVNKEPMPIRYKINLNSDLFILLPQKTKQWIQKAKASYIQGIKDYCARQGCSNPTPDRELPKRTYDINCINSGLYGGYGGRGFGFTTKFPDYHITRVFVRHAKQIDAIQVTATGPDGRSQSSGYYGGYGGNPTQFVISNNDYINQIEVRAGTRIDQLRFRTNGGQVSNTFGGNGGQYFILSVPDGFRWAGIAGRFDQRLDQIYFIYCKTTYRYGHHHEAQTKFDVINLKKEE